MRHFEHLVGPQRSDRPGYVNDILQIQRGGFWKDIDPIVNIARLDRVFVGAANQNDGKLTNTTKDWLETERTSTTNNSQFTVLSRIGQLGVLGGSRTSDSPGAGSEGCIGVCGIAVNNNATQVQTAYGGYFEARRKAGAGIAHGLEIDILNQGSEIDLNAYGNFTTGLTSGLWLASGGGVVGAADASIGIFFVNNSARFKKGIIFGATALEGTDGTGTGGAIAIEMARGHSVQWLRPDSNPAVLVGSDVSNSGPLQKLLFSDIGVLFRNQNDKNMFRIDHAGTFVNGIDILPQAAGASPTIQASGDDTNIDLTLAPKGTGNIRFGTFTAAVTAVNGFITIKDAAGNARKVATLT